MINFQLIGISGTKFEGNVYEVVFPTSQGSIAVFEGHMPLMTTAGFGIVDVRKSSNDSNDQLEHFAILGGMAQTDGKTLTILADEVVSPDEIIEEEVALAKANAEKLLKEAKNPLDLEQAKKLLLQSNTRLQVAKLKKQRHRQQ